MKYVMRKLTAEVSDDEGREYRIEITFNPHIDFFSVHHAEDIEVNVDQARTASRIIVDSIASKLDKLGLFEEWSVPSKVP